MSGIVGRSALRTARPGYSSIHRNKDEHPARGPKALAKSRLLVPGPGLCIRPGGGMAGFRPCHRSANLMSAVRTSSQQRDRAGRQRPRPRESRQVISLQSPAMPGPRPANHRAATEHPSLRSRYLAIACVSSRALSSREATFGRRHRLPVPNRTFNGVGRTHDSKIKSAAAVVSAEAARPFHSQGR